MQYLVYLLALLLPYTICAQTSSQQGVISFACPVAPGKFMAIPVADTRVSVRSSCSLSNTRSKRLTEFPKTFIPGFNQKLSVKSATGQYSISPINKEKYPNAYAITSDGCNLAAVMMAGPRGLPGSQSATSPGVVTRPANSVRTRPGSLAPQSVRTFRPVVARSESSTGKLEKRAIKGSDLVQCNPKTYDWDADVSGKGRQVGSVPVPGRRVPL